MTRPPSLRDPEPQAEYRFLLGRIAVHARGRFMDEHNDLAMEAWIKLFLWKLTHEPVNKQAVMTKIAWCVWISAYRKKQSEKRRLGERIDMMDDEIVAPLEEPAADSAEIELAAFAALEWFRAHSPTCVRLAQYRAANVSWADARVGMNTKSNTLAQQWRRCRIALLDAARHDRGSLARMVDTLEELFG